MRDLKIGLKHEKVLRCYHPDALQYYNTTSNLKEVCEIFEDVSYKLEKNVFRLFSPIRPMLAGKKTLEDMHRHYHGLSMFVETKYDGERIQCHVTKDDIKYFTRNANDYTYLYAKKLNPIIRDCLMA